MARGGKRIPTEALILKGRYMSDYDRDPAREPKPRLGIPDCPAHLDDEAKAEWFRIVPELQAMSILSRVDGAALAAYCQSYSLWVQASLKVRELGIVVKSPNGWPMQSPYLSIANVQMEAMRKFLTEFGCTPSSRSKVKVSMDVITGNEFDQFVDAG